VATTHRPADRDEAVVGSVSPAASSSTIDQLLERYGDAARRAGAAHGLSGDDLDEVLQEVRIRLWHAGRASAAVESMTSSYIYRAAASAAIDLLRRRRARREERIESDAQFEAAAARTAGPDDVVISAETIRAVGDALDDIPVNRRAVVRMYLTGYAREEIATLLGWTEAKTRNLLYRGLDDLRQRLIVRGIHQ
jgi:RNA polymerase sigma factor (sigma-70 family)